jgi:predicted MPP superfamily phosphohydrolase
VLESYDLVLSGHIHGGQYVIPFLTKKILDWRNGQDIEFYAGEYKEKETMIYVTRGVGQWFPGRFNCPPELVILDLMLPKD